MPSSIRIRRSDRWVVIIVLLLSTFTLFLTSPKSGDFSWSDAPRHALNGAFMKDLLAQGHFVDFRQYAEHYYLQYPALTIGFYPPLFSLALACFYAAFGVSHFVAQACVSFFHFGLGLAAYLLARRWLSPCQALGAALLLMWVPEIAFWGRQVMLDVPAICWLLFSTVFFLKYLDNVEPRFLYVSSFLLVCALYTKQTLVYMLLVFLISLVLRLQKEVFKHREIWRAGVAIIAALVPLGILTYYFGHPSWAQVVGFDDLDIPRYKLEAWAYYALQLPQQLGWPLFLAVCASALACLFGYGRRFRDPDTPFLFTWLAVGYVFFSAIGLREARHDMSILFPATIFAVLFVSRSISLVAQPIVTNLAVLILAVSTLFYSLFYRPVPFIGGYAEAAHWVSTQAPERSVILFSGQRDGTFIFDLRADQPKKGVSVLRADKILLKLAIKREFGVEDRHLSKEDILKILQNCSVRYVVAQPHFWIDLPSMKALDELLNDSKHFKVVRKIMTWGSNPRTDDEILIYKTLDPVADEPEPVNLELSGFHRTIRGIFGMVR
jgi:4-amino-4-deoxy-L-arabinose transferase-like glycosyltransferase